jgi:FecR protein
MHMLNLVSRIAACIALLVLPSLAQAAGTAVAVDPDAEARGRQTRTLVVGSDIFIGDRVVTDARGLVQIIFDDKTKLVVGPRSALLIEDYLIREDGSAGKLAINALSGTFRFITGNSAKRNYVINTPTGQIGVRGTAFDLYSTKSAAYVLRLSGTVIGCPRGGDCETIAKGCEVGVIKVGDVHKWGSARDLTGEEREKAEDFFRYSMSQSPLMRTFRVSGAETCMRQRRRGVSVEVPESLGDPSIGFRRPPSESGGSIKIY